MLIIDKITSQFPNFCINVSYVQIPEDIILSDNEFNVPKNIDFLLSSDIFFKIPNSNIIFQNTLLGYEAVETTEYPKLTMYLHSLHTVTKF